jgi:hypothetical protein
MGSPNQGRGMHISGEGSLPGVSFPALDLPDLSVHAGRIHPLQESMSGLGGELSEEEARALSLDLIHRQKAEREEEIRVQGHGHHAAGVKGRFILIDGEGVKVLEP